MALIGMFILFFLLGPLMFRSLVGRQASNRWLRALAVGMSLACALALAIRYGLPHPLREDPVMVSTALLLLWLTWIASLVLGTHLLRRVDPSPHMKRWSRALGMLATTVPWFGFAAASAVAA